MPFLSGPSGDDDLDDSAMPDARRMTMAAAAARRKSLAPAALQQQQRSVQSVLTHTQKALQNEMLIRF